MRVRTTYFIPLITLGLLLAAAFARAQSHPSLAARQAIVTALNNALAANTASLSLSATELFDAVDDACGTVDPFNLDIIYGSGSFTLRRKMRSGASFGIPTEHELVNDLNAWLNAVWAMDLTYIHEFDTLGWACSNPGQRYYTQATTDSNAVAYVKDISGENDILNRYYTIGGGRYRGSSFLSFSNDSVRRVKYITDLGAGGDTDRVRLLSKAYLSITCPGDSAPALTFVFDIEMEQNSGDCGIPREQPVNVRISAATYNCAFFFDFLAGDILNRKIFEEVLHFRNGWHTPVNLIDTTSPNGLRVTDSLGAFELGEDGYFYLAMFHNNECDTARFNLCYLSGDSTSPDEYCEATFCEGGTFGLDTYGRLVYNLPGSGCDEECTSVPVPCIQFCDLARPEPPVMTHVIKADARTFTDTSALLPESVFPAVYPEGTPNDFEIGRRGKWRSAREYVYRIETKPGSGLFSANPSPSTERNYNDAGTFNLDLFTWRGSNDTVEWLNTTRVTRYSQNGEPVEEQDVFFIPSAARYGYHGRLPVLLAKNSPYGACFFQSFEADVPDNTPGNGDVVTDHAHAGHRSYEVPQSVWSDPIETAYEVTPAIAADGLLVRLWAKHTYPNTAAHANIVSPVQVKLVSSSTSVTVTGSQLRRVAKTGEWALYEATVTGVPAGTYSITVSAALGTADIWLDDLRIQPVSSEMVCHVYDPATFRLLATFDEAHFGIYYQYNGEGKLVRKIRETMRGFRTVQETQYHTPEIARAYGSSGVSGTLRDRGPGTSSRSAKAILGEVTAPAASDENRIALLDAEFGLDRREVKVLGMDAERLGERIEELRRLLDSPPLKRLEIPAVRTLELMTELEQADSALAALHDVDTTTMSEVERMAHQGAEARAAELRRRMLGRLGISEAEARELIQALQAVKKEKDEE